MMSRDTPLRSKSARIWRRLFLDAQERMGTEGAVTGDFVLAAGGKVDRPPYMRLILYITAPPSKEHRPLDRCRVVFPFF